MATTANSDVMSVTHADSSCICIIFPDVCKTPIPPAGPVPIPYPNIAQSSDAADAASTVKLDGKAVMTKAGNYSKSSGDEAGTAKGVASSDNKGKAEPILYSFTVKVDGDNVFRLVDMVTQNKKNTPPGTNVQMPVVAIPMVSKECDATKKKLEKDSSNSEPAWGESGVISEHRGHIKKTATDHHLAIYIRQTKSVCEPWIRAKHQPKPHSCMKGTTIKPEDLEKVRDWLQSYFITQGKEDAVMAELSHTGKPAHKRLYVRQPADYFKGIIGMPVRKTMIRPMPGGGRQTISYSGKWMTADYDLFEVLMNLPGCRKVVGDFFALVKKEINVACQWDAIQHPPQAQWVPNSKEMAEGVKPTNMNVNVRGALQKGADRKIEVPVLPPPRTKMKVLDKPLTIVTGAGVGELKDQDAVAEALICQECDE